MDPTLFDPANPDHLKSLNSALEGFAIGHGRNCDRLDDLEKRKPKTTLVAWILMACLLVIGVAGLTVSIVKGKPELVLTDEALQGIAVNVNTTIPNGAVQVTPNVTATLSAPADGFKVNPEGLSEIATVIRAQTSSNEAWANAMVEKMGTTLTPPPAPAPVVSAVSPPTATVVPEAPPAPAEWLKESKPTDPFDGAKVNWVQPPNNNRYNIPTLGPRKLAIRSSEHPPISKPKGWEKAEWTLINGGDWALFR